MKIEKLFIAFLTIFLIVLSCDPVFEKKPNKTLTDTEAVAIAKAALIFDTIKGSNNSENNILYNLNLITAGEEETVISWKTYYLDTTNDASSNLTTTGIVTRPNFGESDKSITIVATISKGTASDTKSFNILIPAYESQDEQDVTEAMSDLTFDTIKAENSSINNVITNLDLITIGLNSTDIEWLSDNTTDIANNGTVTRPLNGQNSTINLTATITKGSSTATKEFIITVIKHPWELTTNITGETFPASAGVACTTFNNKIYIGGRYTYSTDTFVFNGTSFSKGPDLPNARRNTTFIVYDNTIVCVGGTTDTGNVSYDVWKLSSDELSWESTMGSLETALTTIGLGITNDGKLYAVGGYVNNSITTVQLYDSSTTSWSISADDVMPSAYSTQHSAITFNNKIFVVGMGVNKDEVWSFDGTGTAGSRWTKEVSTPSGFAAVPFVLIYRNRIYAIGGTKAFSWIPSESEWREEPGLPSSRLRGGAGVINDAIYYIGGTSNLDGAGSSNWTDTVFMYKP